MDSVIRKDNTMFIAKMHTMYPDYHGSGYYNFLMSDNEDELNDKIEEYSHDFMLEKVVKTRHKSAEAVIKQYPTKESLNDKYFKDSFLRG